MLKSISGFYFNDIGFNCHKRNKAVSHFRHCPKFCVNVKRIQS